MGNQFCRMTELLETTFIFQFWRDKILRHWSNFNLFYMIQQFLSQNGRVIYSSLLYFNFENLKSSNSTSSTRCQYTLYMIQQLFGQCFRYFLKSWRRELIRFRELILQNSWIICLPLLCFKVEKLKNLRSTSMIIFPCILHDLVV